jgi:hypothetical protein
MVGAGTVVGGLLGAPAGGFGAIPGAALGAGGGEALYQALRGTPAKKQVAPILKAGAGGATAEMGGQIIGKGAEIASPYLGRALGAAKDYYGIGPKVARGNFPTVSPEVPGPGSYPSPFRETPPVEPWKTKPTGGPISFEPTVHTTVPETHPYPFTEPVEPYRVTPTGGPISVEPTAQGAAIRQPETAAKPTPVREPTDIMRQPLTTSRATSTGAGARLPAGLHADLEKQAGRSLTDEEAVLLDRANLERQMASGIGKPDEASAIREAHREKLEKPGRPEEPPKPDLGTFLRPEERGSPRERTNPANPLWAKEGRTAAEEGRVGGTEHKGELEAGITRQRGHVNAPEVMAHIPENEPELHEAYGPRGMTNAQLKTAYESMTGKKIGAVSDKVGKGNIRRADAVREMLGEGKNDEIHTIVEKSGWKPKTENPPNLGGEEKP